ncbi:MAG: aspartate/glutamate racemase family protein [Pseudomonadota bacterium]
MAIVIINPNSTVSMTEAMVNVAEAAAPGLAFEGWTSSKGPASIQGAADGAAAVPPMLELVAKASAKGADGILIGCFDDTGLAQAAAHATCPVIGLGQAAYHYAAMRQWRFSVVTTLAVSIPVLDGNITAMGLAPYLGRVRASGVPVLDLEADPQSASARVVAEAETAVASDQISAVILGCAGMVQVVLAVREALDIPVIDPVECAATSFKWLAAR